MPFEQVRTGNVLLQIMNKHCKRNDMFQSYNPVHWNFKNTVLLLHEVGVTQHQVRMSNNYVFHINVDKFEYVRLQKHVLI